MDLSKGAVIATMGGDAVVYIAEGEGGVGLLATVLSSASLLRLMLASSWDASSCSGISSVMVSTLALSRLFLLTLSDGGSMMGEYCNGFGGYWRETMLDMSSALLVVAVEMALFRWLLFVLNFFLRNVDDFRNKLAADEVSSLSSSSICGC